MIRMLPTSRRFTLVPDAFILESMSKLSSSVIKVYLFVLYQFGQNYECLDLDEIADRLNLTESDIFRALHHLAKEQLLRCETTDGEYRSVALPETAGRSVETLRHLAASGLAADRVGSVFAGTAAADTIGGDLSAPAENLQRFANSPAADRFPLASGENSAIAEKRQDFSAGQVSDSAAKGEDLTAPVKSADFPADASDSGAPSANQAAANVPATERPGRRPAYSAELIEDFAKNKDGDELIFYTQTLLKKNLTPNDLHILFGLKDWLKMSDTLIYFLIEYCAERNHTHLNYIEKIAIDWHEKRIETVEQAKDYLAAYPSHYYTVLKAYGIYNLAPIPAQIKMIDKWLKDYRLPLDLIVYACEKTILQAGKPELNYTDSILKAWQEKQLFSREQVDKAEANKPKKAAPTAAGGKPAKSAAGVKTTTFNNYTQRREDYDAIEKKAFAMRIQKKESEQ